MQFNKPLCGTKYVDDLLAREAALLGHAPVIEQQEDVKPFGFAKEDCVYLSKALEHESMKERSKDKDCAIMHLHELFEGLRQKILNGAKHVGYQTVGEMGVANYVDCRSVQISTCSEFLRLKAKIRDLSIELREVRISRNNTYLWLAVETGVVLGMIAVYLFAN